MTLCLETLITEDEIFESDVPTMSQSPANCAACTKCGGGGPIVRPRGNENISEVDVIISKLEEMF